VVALLLRPLKNTCDDDDDGGGGEKSLLWPQAVSSS